jgi:hypothetical protein
MPTKFIKYFRYLAELEYHQTPNYSYLKNLFKEMLKEKNLDLDY